MLFCGILRYTLCSPSTCRVAVEGFPEYCSQTNKRRNLSVAAAAASIAAASIASIACIAGGGGGPVTKPKYLPTFGEKQIYPNDYTSQHGIGSLKHRILHRKVVGLDSGIPSSPIVPLVSLV